MSYQDPIRDEVVKLIHARCREICDDGTTYVNVFDLIKMMTELVRDHRARVEALEQRLAQYETPDEDR